MVFFLGWCNCDCTQT